ncbi:MAG: hypothetical protein JWR10_3413 [Rubritepida sp.]|nr:hypothetical protein [Rubritepida sp.]
MALIPDHSAQPQPLGWFNAVAAIVAAGMILLAIAFIASSLGWLA